MADSAALPPVCDECHGDLDVNATTRSSIARSAGPGYHVWTPDQPDPTSSNVKRLGKVSAVGVCCAAAGAAITATVIIIIILVFLLLYSYFYPYSYFHPCSCSCSCFTCAPVSTYAYAGRVQLLDTNVYVSTFISVRVFFHIRSHFLYRYVQRGRHS